MEPNPLYLVNFCNVAGTNPFEDPLPKELSSCEHSMLLSLFFLVNQFNDLGILQREICKISRRHHFKNALDKLLKRGNFLLIEFLEVQHSLNCFCVSNLVFALCHRIFGAVDKGKSKLLLKFLQDIIGVLFLSRFYFILCFLIEVASRDLIDNCL